MATSTDSGNEENPTPTSRLSQLSFDGSEEQVAQLLPPGTASVDCASRPDKPNDDENEDLALALILSQLSSEDFDERVAQLDQASAPSDEKVHPITPPNENDDDELELALTLSQLPADIFDQQIGELNRKGEPREAAPASSPSAISLSEDDMRRALDNVLASGFRNDASRSAMHDDYSQALALAQQGTSLVQRYERSGMLTELEEGINALYNAIGFIPNQPRKLLPFAISDLNEAITAQQQAVRLTQDRHPHKVSCLNNLGNSFQSRFERLGDFHDLDEAITMKRQAVRLTPQGHPDQPMYLNNLGNSLHSRFETRGDLADLNDATTAQQRAVRLTPDGDPDQPMYLTNLGSALLHLFERLGNLANLHEAIKAQQQAVHSTPAGHPDRRRYLTNLGTSFLCRFEHLGDLADVDEAIKAQRQAIRLTPDGHPEKPVYLNNLGNSFTRRYERLGAHADTDEAIFAHQQAVSLTPDGHPRKPERLNNLGNSLFRRFEALGNLVNLDEAITAQRQAVRLIPDGHPGQFVALNNLGASIQIRFDRLGELSDLDEAITVKQQAVRFTPDNHPHKPFNLHNLGISFVRRFQRLGGLGDIDKAILVQQQAIRLAPDGHPDRPMYFSGLGISHLCRFESLGEPTDVDEAITAQRKAISLTSDDNAHKPMFLNNLGNSFLRRFERLGDLANLDEAIKAQQLAIRLTPDGHSHKTTRLNNLGNCFHTRLRHQPDDATLDQAIGAYSQSAMSLSGSPSIRFQAARMWATLCSSYHSNEPETLDAYSHLVDLLPRVVWLGRTVEQRYKDIASVGDAATNAAAAAIHLGKPGLALEWLEQGRSIVWGQIHQLRTPFENLRQHHPDEADELEKISRALESAGAVDSPDRPGFSGVDTSQTQEEIAQAHRRLADQFDGLLKRIRSFPDFSEFLLPRKSSSLCSAAVSGPVVVVNAHDSRCDALILRPNSSEVCHVALSGLQVSEARKMQPRLAKLTGEFQRDYTPYSDDELAELPSKGIEFSDILEQLWLQVVDPVLRSLELLQIPAPDEMPHITWCLTGLLTFLPIHAAGLYGAKGQPKIFDYVVSSYTPTLTALLSAKRLHAPTQPNGTPRLLAVSQPATPRLRPLPGTVREVDAIQTIQASTGRLPITRLNNQEATIAAVLQGMKECNWIHFACHGVQDAANATDSAFMLIDGRLTLKEIMKQSFSHTELAVLSACQTAKGDKRLPEEAIHLAAGMLLAGYGSIVATMWTIGDDDGPIVAERFYTCLIVKAGGDSTRAAYALHDAVAHLREVTSEKNFASWVPFIHLGFCSPSLSST